MRAPRLLPLVGVALGGVLAVKALSGVTHLPDLVEATKAFAEGVAPAKTKDAGKLQSSSAPAVDPNAPVLPPGLSPKVTPLPGSPEAIAAAANAAAQGGPPKIACPATPAELARDAGLSPAELQVLQSLGSRRGQLDQREQDLDVQTQLLTAAETKLDAKLQALADMKGELQKLLDEGDAKKSGEIDALVTVYSKMRPRDAADRLALLDDSVRLPIAAKMKPAALSQIVGQMPPTAAKELTEKLAGRFESKLLADARQAVSGQPAAGQTPAPNAQAADGQPPPAAAAAPKKVAHKSRRAKPATQLAANTATPPAAGSTSTSAPAASTGPAASAARSATPSTSAPAAAKPG
jgi:flagellar motility protein MotE (MotC chaperone)